MKKKSFIVILYCKISVIMHHLSLYYMDNPQQKMAFLNIYVMKVKALKSLHKFCPHRANTTFTIIMFATDDSVIAFV